MRNFNIFYINQVLTKKVESSSIKFFYITPLFTAIIKDNKEIVQLLLAHKDIDVNIAIISNKQIE